ncbi:MAG: CDP-diacylglycerol--serine O-phosphatidyltransferase, partial [Acidobacteria bacterium]|nr:CDP-diacylglycerol--serine O-phosphatidyltransferase [Acidobacteriota bacterium]
MRRPPKGLQQRLRKSIFLLPSLFTTGNLLLGFYAIILAYRERFVTAAALIFVAAVVDMLDGRIARMTHTESDFGREYDSLADLTTFGTAPALLAYFWGLQDLARAGWIVPLFFVVCCAARLARFNIQDGPLDSRFFVGMPAPAAACSLSSILFAFPHRAELGDPWSAVLTGAVVAALIAL